MYPQDSEMWVAVLALAFADLENDATRLDAFNWITSTNRDVGSFNWICHHVGVEPAYLRRGLQHNLTQQHIPPVLRAVGESESRSNTS